MQFYFTRGVLFLVVYFLYRGRPRGWAREHANGHARCIQIARYCGAGDTEDAPNTLSVQTSESDHPQAVARGGQARHLRPAVRSRVVDLRRAKILTGAETAEDVELATHRCGGVKPPSGAHACQLRPCIGLRIVHVG